MARLFSNDQTFVIQSITSNYTAQRTDNVLLCDASGGAITITLYSPTLEVGRSLYIKKTDSTGNTITIDPSANTIDGYDEVIILHQNESLHILCDGSNFWII